MIPSKHNPTQTAMHCLNAVFATVTQRRGDYFHQLKHVIDFLHPQWNELSRCEETLTSLAERLLRFYEPEIDQLYLEHCHFSADVGGLLWLREVLLIKLRSMSVISRGVLLISGLKNLFKPPGRRWTRNRRIAYLEARTYCEELVRQWTPASSQRHILFIEL